MKVKYIWNDSLISDDFEKKINEFIKGKNIVDIKFQPARGAVGLPMPFALVMYEEVEEEPSAQETSSTEIINLLSHAGYADLIYNERVLNGIEAVLIQLGYEVKDD